MPSDPLSAGAAKGVAGAAATQVASKLEELAFKIKAGKVYGLGDRATVSEILSEKTSGEYRDWEPFMSEGSHQDLVMIGRYLRRIAANQDQVQKVRQAVIRDYGPKGLRLAQSVQATLAGVILDMIRSLAKTQTEYVNRAQEFFKDVDNYVLFAEVFDDPKTTCETVRKHLKSHFPPVFVLAGSGKAMSVVSQIAFCLRDKVPDYTYRLSQDATYQRNYFYQWNF